MRLSELRLRNYRQYADLDLAFPEGVVGIVGPNGSGKSTLLEAVRFCLYGPDACRTTKEGVLRAGAEWPCWAEVAFESPEHGAVVFRRELDGDAKVTANRKLVAKSARGATQYAVSLFGDLRAFELAYDCRQKELDAFSRLRPAERREHLLRWLGIARLDKVVDKVRADAREAKATWEGMAAALPDPEVLAKAVADLDAALGEAGRHAAIAEDSSLALAGEVEAAAAKARDLLARDREAEALRRKLAAAEAAQAQREARQREVEAEVLALDGLEAKRLEIRAALAPLAGAGERAASLLRQRDAKATLEREAARIQGDVARTAKELREAEAVDETVGTAEDLPTFEADATAAAESIEAASGPLLAAKAAHAEASPALAKLRERYKAVRDLGTEAPCPVCTRPLGADGQAHVLAELEAEGKALTNRLTALEREIQDRAALLPDLRRRKDETVKRLEDARLARVRAEEASKRADALKVRLTDLRTSLDRAEAAIAEAADVSEAAVRTAKDEATKADALASELARLEGRLEALGRGRAEAASLEAAIRVGGDQIDGFRLALTSSAPDPAEVVAAQESLTKAEKEAHAAALQAERLRAEATGLTARLKEAQARQAEAEEKHGRAEAVRARSQALAVLAEALATFRGRLAGRIRPALSALASELFVALVEGRYEGIELTEDYEVLVQEQGIQYPLARCSGGEEDLAALAIRLAVARLVAGAGAAPRFLLLDEPFTSLDAGHLANAMATLRHLRASFPQIIVVSHMAALKDAATTLFEVRELADGTSVAVEA